MLSNCLICFQFDLDLEDHYYEVYVGKNASYIYELFEKKKSNWKTILYTKTPSIRCSPFAVCCIGIKTTKSYKIRLTVEGKISGHQIYLQHCNHSSIIQGHNFDVQWSLLKSTFKTYRGWLLNSTWGCWWEITLKENSFRGKVLLSQCWKFLLCTLF